MAKRIQVRGARGGHWKQAAKALSHNGVVMTTLVTAGGEKGQPKGDVYALLSLRPERLVPFGYGTEQRLIPSRNVLVELGAELSPATNRLIDAFRLGGVTMIVNTPEGRRCVAIPGADLSQNLLLEIQQPVFFQEILDTDSVEDLKSEYGNAVDLWLDPGIETFRPSTLIDVSRQVPVLLRKGLVPILDVENVLGQRVKLGPDVIFTVLFICTGNTCRSAMARGILEARLRGERVMVYSAGTHDFGRMPASEGALIAARDFGGDLSNHYSVPLNRYLIDVSDLILCMELRHRRRVLELSPDALSRTFLLTAYAGGTGFEEVFDPVGSTLPVFRKVAELINQCLDDVVRDTKDRAARETEC